MYANRVRESYINLRHNIAIRRLDSAPQNPPDGVRVRPKTLVVDARHCLQGTCRRWFVNLNAWKIAARRRPTVRGAVCERAPAGTCFFSRPDVIDQLCKDLRVVPSLSDFQLINDIINKIFQTAKRIAFGDLHVSSL